MEIKSKLIKTLALSDDVYDHEYDPNHILFASEDIEIIKNRLSQAVYLLNHTVASIFIVDFDRRVIMGNQMIDHMTKIKRPFKGHHFEEFVPINFEEPYYKKIWETALEFGFWQGQIAYESTTGDKIYQWMKIFRLQNKHGETSEVGIMLFDMSESVQMLQDINHVSYYDFLTNLPNWRQFNLDIENYIRQDSEQHVAYCVMVRLANLSEINVLYGNKIGDMVIQGVVERFHHLLMPNCKLYRIVGDVFAIFASNIGDVELFNEQISQMKQMTRTPFLLEGHSVNLESTFGLSVYPKDADNHHDLINDAEIALNLSGKSREDINFYSQSMNEKYIRSLEITGKIKEAMFNDRMDVFYQPILEANTQKVVAVEGLLRWHDPDLGYISPEEILRVAEAHNYLFDLEFWVIEHIFKTLGNPNFALFINVSLKLIEYPCFIERLMRLVHDYQIDATNVVFEITEHHAIQSSTIALKTLNQLCDFGFKIALDDFGVGYSSVSLLVQFPIHIVKLDRSFIEGLLHDQKHITVVKSIAEMVKRLGMLSVCEGIETENHAKFVSTLGVDYLQGYYYSRPIAYKELQKFLACNRIASKSMIKNIVVIFTTERGMYEQ